MQVDLTLPSGITLAYLRGPVRGRWEALVRLPLDSTSISLHYAVGFGCDHNPSTAISLALDALDRDPQLIEQALAQPTCAPTISDSALANLLTPSPMTSSKPLFKIKT